MNMSVAVGSVPYVNAVPLTRSLQNVQYAVPSALPELLDSGQVAAILVSSYYALTNPGLKMAKNVCIGSNGRVKSVRLFSKVPFRGIQRLAFDASSMTSNRLAQILLRDAYKTVPATVTRPPILTEMLEDADAAILIGDTGMKTDGTGLFVLDLGEAWTRLTGLPFVWAGWIGRESLTPELSKEFERVMHASGVGRDRPYSPAAEATIEAATSQSDWTEDEVRDYFMNIMVYECGSQELKGFHEFRERLGGIVRMSDLTTPDWV